MERTFKVSWIQDTDLIATTLLNERGLQSAVEWEGQLSGKPTIQTSAPLSVHERTVPVSCDPHERNNSATSARSPDDTGVRTCPTTAEEG
jgi:hypothetical protein